ncbi:MAG: DctP family TRAP transporter solute-binding subunit [Tepidanaerobacteraceae bacterium]|nr:DctP family TRAP transporter solute-binding subunit [Tepidanaerobacteraceae bacterium]
MKKILSMVLIGALLVTLLVGCGKTQDNQEQGNSADDQITLKVAHIFSSTHPADIALQKFKEIVERDTDGRVTVDIYNSGVLGGDVEEIQQVVAGQLDAAVVMGVALWQGMDPRTAIEEVPFLFKDADMAHRAYDGAFGEKLAKEVLEPTGVKVLAYWENGFRHFTNNKRPIYKPEDMVGIKFRSAQSPLRIQMFQELGANAIPMAFPEVFTGLQQGTIDGQENPLATIESSKFYEVQEYLSLSGHIYSCAPFVINPKIWESYPDDVKEVILKAAAETRDMERQLIAENDQQYIDTMKKAGIKVNEVDKDAFKEAVQSVWDIFKEDVGSDLIDAVLQFENE